MAVLSIFVTIIRLTNFGGKKILFDLVKVLRNIFALNVSNNFSLVIICVLLMIYIRSVPNIVQSKCI